jgi:hypothetical protein
MYVIFVSSLLQGSRRGQIKADPYESQELRTMVLPSTGGYKEMSSSAHVYEPKCGDGGGGGVAGSQPMSTVQLYTP